MLRPAAGLKASLRPALENSLKTRAEGTFSVFKLTDRIEKETLRNACFARLAKLYHIARHKASRKVKYFSRKYLMG